MALDSHIESLRRKHAHIDQMLHEESIRPSTDDAVLHRLKTQKLVIKDEIERLTHAHRAAA